MTDNLQAIGTRYLDPRFRLIRIEAIRIPHNHQLPTVSDRNRHRHGSNKHHARPCMIGISSRFCLCRRQAPHYCPARSRPIGFLKATSRCAPDYMLRVRETRPNGLGSILARLTSTTRIPPSGLVAFADAGSRPTNLRPVPTGRCGQARCVELSTILRKCERKAWISY